MLRIMRNSFYARHEWQSSLPFSGTFALLSHACTGAASTGTPMTVARPSGRTPEQMRRVRIERAFTRHAEGSVLVCFGETRVLCTASVENRVPAFLRGKGEGWVT